MTAVLDTGRFKIGLDHPTYFIADIAANHDGDLGRAKELIHMCAEAGANAAKFQNFLAATIVSERGFEALGGQQSHQANWSKRVYDVYDDAALPVDWTETLRETCDAAGIDYFTAPYDLDMLPYLSKYVVAWKLGSGDITWHELIERMAKDGKPLFMATGAADMEEVTMAVEVAARHTDQICVMQCNTNYTGSRENFGYIALNVLKSYASAFPNAVLGLIGSHAGTHDRARRGDARGAGDRKAFHRRPHARGPRPWLLDGSGKLACDGRGNPRTGTGARSADQAGYGQRAGNGGAAAAGDPGAPGAVDRRDGGKGGLDRIAAVSP